MLRFVIGALAVALVVPGCSGSSIRSQEGHACSTNSSDDPQLICTPAQDLVCIHTYSAVVTNEQEAKKFDGGIRPVYVCRIACSTTDDCRQAGDVCCKGTIHGKTYDKMAGCVPQGKCETDRPPEPDAGLPVDSAPRMDARPADMATAPAEGGTGIEDAPAPAADTAAVGPDGGAGG